MISSTDGITWLHLSDFHVGKDDYATRKMFDYILKHVEARKTQGLVPDILFVTGDIANKGAANEYDSFWNEFMLPLQKLIGNGIENRTFIVPGNHDVDRNKMPAFSQVDILNPKSHYFDPTEEGARLRGDMLVPRFKNFLESDLTFHSAEFNKPAGAYASTFTLKNQKVGVVGLNTAWLCKDDGDKGNLTPGKSLLESALKKLADSHLKIVIGHHPVDWFNQAQQQLIKSVLGQHLVLYLHGHLHNAWAEPTYGGGQSYLSVQSGAGFQAREGEYWQNGIVWGKVPLGADEVMLQPMQWITEQQTWGLTSSSFHEEHRDGEWWRYQLPKHLAPKSKYAPSAPQISTPKGWSVFDFDSLMVYEAPLNDVDAIRYFDGAVPDWNIALSKSIPRRSIVSELISLHQKTIESGKHAITLLLAAGCEGKTTALLQAAYAIIKGKSDWRILQRRNESLPLVATEVLPILDAKYRWLLLIDEADNAIEGLQTLLSQASNNTQKNLHILLACRDTDWLALETINKTSQTSKKLDISKVRLSGLNAIDAQAIVQAWEQFDVLGLGKLEQIPAAERGARLVYEAKEEAKTKSGAFFGALLAARNGNDLSAHARALLYRLSERNITGGATLRDAIALISAMHAQGLEFLSRPVLAQALGCPIDKLHREVVVPLGQEAAATSSSSFIFTRHQRIAETLALVLSEEFGEDIDSLYVKLARAAIEYSKVSGQPNPENLALWRYEISNHFLASNQEVLAFDIAQSVLALEETNSFTRTHVANLYRKAAQPKPEQALLIFEGISGSVPNNRAYYYEWSVAHGECANYAENVLLASYSLSDQCPAKRVDIYQATQSLSGLGVPFGYLYDLYKTNTFRDARMAVATIGEKLANAYITHAIRPSTMGRESEKQQLQQKYFDKHKNESNAQGAKIPTPEQAIYCLKQGIEEAQTLRSNIKLEQLLPSATDMTFEGLEKLLLDSAILSGGLTKNQFND